MSGITGLSKDELKSSVGVYIADDVAESSSIDRAYKVLAGFPKGAQKAVGSAIKRAAQSGETYAARAVRNEYYVTASTFKEYTKSKRHIYTKGGSTSVDIEFRGYHIPLLKFDVKVGKDGGVSARVKRTSVKTALDHAFKQDVGKYGHSGIFERVSDDRLPIKELYGPSTPQMMASNEDVEQETADKMNEVFTERLEHEITAILNGWRK